MRSARRRGGGAILSALAAITMLVLVPPPPARARELIDIFHQELAGLELEPVGNALAKTIASTYPVASASSSVTYVYNPATDSFDRETGVLGPIFGERAETIGERRIDVSMSYSYVEPTSINGQSLSDLHNAPVVNGRVITFPVPDGIQLADGRITTFLPVDVHADLTVRAQILSPAITYGITSDLDVNLTLPLLWTYLRARTNSQYPDPRLPQFALPPLPSGEPDIRTFNSSAQESAFGVGDLLLRAKYVVHRGDPVDLAAGLGLSLPTGNVDNLQGTGTTRVLPTLILSHVFLDRIEPLLNLGMDLNCNDVSRSVFRWAVGATARIVGQLTGAVVFLGANELEAQTEPIEAPFFVQIQRNDLYDVSVGFRYLLGSAFVVAANVLVPLNDDGLRAVAIPTVQLEYEFGAPW